MEEWWMRWSFRDMNVWLTLIDPEISNNVWFCWTKFVHNFEKQCVFSQTEWLHWCRFLIKTLTHDWHRKDSFFLICCWQKDKLEQNDVCDMGSTFSTIWLDDHTWFQTTHNLSITHRAYDRTNASFARSFTPLGRILCNNLL